MQRLIKHHASVWLCLLLAGCASSTQNTTESAGDRIGGQSIDQFDSTPGRETGAPAVPDAVTRALMPDVAGSLGVYDPSTERFDISVTNTSVTDFFPSLVADTPYNLVVHPDVVGSVTLDLKSVTVEDVLEVVQELYGFDVRKKGNFIQVLPTGLRTEIYRLNYLNVRRRGGSEIQVSAGSVSNAGPTGQNGQQVAGSFGSPEAGQQQGRAGLIGSRITTETDSEFWVRLVETLELIVGSGDERAVMATPDAGMIVVRAMPQEHVAVARYLREAELTMQRQVILEARIVEVTLNNGNQQGIDWSAIGRISENNRFGPANLFAGQTGGRVTNPGLEGMFAAAIETNDFNIFIELLSTQGDVRVLSSPRIATVNNQKAVIKVGRDEFFVTEIRVNENNNINAQNNTNTDVELTPFFSGIALDVTPQISAEGRIVLHVHPSVSEVEDQTKVVSLGDRDLTLPLALSTIRETDSIIGANDGQVVVIGGLMRNSETRDVAQTPGVGGLPVVGSLFKQRRTQARRSELIILIRPTMADEAGFRDDIQRSRQRFDGLSMGRTAGGSSG